MNKEGILLGFEVEHLGNEHTGDPVSISFHHAGMKHKKAHVHENCLNLSG